MKTDQVKQQVWALAEELNTVLGAPLIRPHQQKEELKNIALKSPEFGTIYIRPMAKGYRIGLSNNSLVTRMAPFMRVLTRHEQDGYAHLQRKREPCWNVADYSQVREAAFFYANLTVPPDESESTHGDLEALAQRKDLNATERDVLVKARLGQGAYRRDMLALWDGACAVTGLTIPQVLVASHAKSWIESSDRERLDPCNGLPLVGTLDKLFDNHLIAFDPETGRMLISDRIEEADRAALNIPTSQPPKVPKPATGCLP
ncbi:HNH endonuclease [Burkholderia sp. PAMC 28687]|uniref:HNH endonuclease n=1 Tax=Burkholderia sp. PAMC 28687 TaxID=1795874 RepID=UPI00156018FC|nr:HNH endonuclease [Burkholderia sp. PAMC 28687]